MICSVEQRKVVECIIYGYLTGGRQKKQSSFVCLRKMNASLVLSKWGRGFLKSLMNPERKFKPATKHNHWNIVRGDKVRGKCMCSHFSHRSIDFHVQVQVIQGPQTGQQGKVLAILRKKNRVIVEGVNMVCEEQDFVTLYAPLILHLAATP